ncbi:hypothetical protein V2J09_014445 [Rumex salicifolius]
MAHQYHHRNYHHLKKSEVIISGFDEVDVDGSTRGNSTLHGFKRAKPRLLFLLVLSVISFILICTCHPFAFPPAFSVLYSPEAHNEDHLGIYSPICSSVPNGTICCDRISHRTDICFMKGDVRTQSASSSIFLYNSKAPVSSSYLRKEEKNNDVQGQEEEQIEKVRPYTRKWETSVMNTIEELKLVPTNRGSGVPQKCDVHHHVPAVFFSTGGYTGNVYHEFNDGIIPLYITSHHLKKKVVFVILEYHNWWFMKYGNILSDLSDYPPIDFNGDNRTHCFPEAIVGLRIHGELTVDATLLVQENTTIGDFRNLLDHAYWPRIRGIIAEDKRKGLSLPPSPSYAHQDTDISRKPKLVILSRNGSRSITNEALLVNVAEKVGFFVQVVKPDSTTELAKMYHALNSSDVMIGVHGAAMTHFLFMKPGSVFIQVIPLGTEWAAATYYGEPAVKLGLKYIGYKVLPKESSLYGQYDKDDPVLSDPDSVVKKGWQYTKKIYLDNQTVEIDIKRFKKRLVQAYDHLHKLR